MDPFEFREGQSPLIVSMPHSGLELTSVVSAGLNDSAKSLPDTDWHLPDLYSFLGDFDVTQLTANYSRYVIDLNRPLDDTPLYNTKTTGLFPEILFDGTNVFEPGREPDAEHQAWCKQHIWQAYHAKLGSELERIQNKFGFAVLLDAHSIAARVPMLFEGMLPDFNFGNNQNYASSEMLVDAMSGVVSDSEYTQVVNGRFKGGYITRSMGRPGQGVHAVQLELSQATYMKEGAQAGAQSQQFELDAIKSENVRPVLQKLIETLIDPQRYIHSETPKTS